MENFHMHHSLDSYMSFSFTLILEFVPRKIELLKTSDY